MVGVFDRTCWPASDCNGNKAEGSISKAFVDFYRIDPKMCIVLSPTNVSFWHSPEVDRMSVYD